MNQLGTGILTNLYSFRHEFLSSFLPALAASRAKPTAQILTQNRSRIEQVQSASPKVLEYLEASDAYTAGFLASDDRTHGEHHKLEVVLLGAYLAKLVPLANDELRDLLYIALNEHDEGRRVTGDADHEAKAAVLVKHRMNGDFPDVSVALVADTIQWHGGITVETEQQYTILSPYLNLADKLAALDPTRHTSYAAKKLADSASYLDVEKIVTHTWYRATRLVRQYAKYFTCSPDSLIYSAAESMEVVLTSLRDGQRNGEPVISQIQSGSDVRSLSGWASTELGLTDNMFVLPVYRTMF